MELGRMLVLVAQSAGVAAREPFWFLAWNNLFSAALTFLEYSEERVPTLQRLIRSILISDELNGTYVDSLSKARGTQKGRERLVEVLARTFRETPAQYLETSSRS